MLAVALVLVGCSEDQAKHERRIIRKQHMPKLAEIIAEDMKAHRRGIWKAAARLGKGFNVEDPEVRARQMRQALKRIQDANAPDKVRVSEFVISPMTFLAAVDRDGTVIARDADPDHMKGLDFGEKYPVVGRALEKGKSGYGLGEFAPVDEGGKDGGSASASGDKDKNESEGESSISMMFVAPVEHDGKRVGAVVAGIPLWRMAQRLSRQLRLEHAPGIDKGLVLWVYIYKGKRMFHFGTPPPLDEVVPGAATRRKGLKESPGGFTGKVQQRGRTYGYGVMPVERMGDDVGLIVMRSDAPE